MRPLYLILTLMIALLAWAQEEPPLPSTVPQAESLGRFNRVAPVAPDPARMPKVSSQILSGPPPPPASAPMGFPIVYTTGYVY